MLVLFYFIDDLQAYILLYILFYVLTIGLLLLLVYNISLNTQYILQYYKQYIYYNFYYIYILCAMLLIIAGIPPFSFFFIKIIYCKYILLYTNFIYFIYFIYFILFMLYFYLKFLQLFFPKNTLYKLIHNIKIHNTYKIEKITLLFIYIMIFFCIYLNDINLVLYYMYS